jgi:hypothetical protein
MIDVIDDVDSECRATVPDLCLSELSVIRELDVIFSRRRKPAMT